MSKVSRARKEVALDIVKEMLIVAVVLALLFAYWMGSLLLLSLFLLNIWHTSFVGILRLGIIFTVISGIIYILIRIYRRR